MDYYSPYQDFLDSSYMPNVLPLSPSNYDMIGRGYQFDSQFSSPSFSSPILGDGTIDLLAQRSILNS